MLFRQLSPSIYKSFEYLDRALLFFKIMIVFDFPVVQINEHDLLPLNRFKEMDYFAVEHFAVPIEFMMENAGLHLAKVAAAMVGASDKIRIGIGPGNNGGGGLVAARRLKAWGYEVELDVWKPGTGALWLRQFQRAKSLGVEVLPKGNESLFVDAYLGFSQRLPLEDALQGRLEDVEKRRVRKLSLDIPTGCASISARYAFRPDVICTLAAPKEVLSSAFESSRILVADLGMPKTVYEQFGVHMLPFDKYSIVEVILA